LAILQSFHTFARLFQWLGMHVWLVDTKTKQPGEDMLQLLGHIAVLHM